MTDKPIYKALATELLCYLNAEGFRTNNVWIVQYLAEAGFKANTEDADTIIMWDTSAEVLQNNIEELSEHKYVVFDCTNSRDTEYGVRLLRKRGFELHSEMTSRIAGLRWGCRILEKVSEGVEDLVTVVVPTYNSSLFIEECLKSILAQSHKAIEVILIDDRSADDTVLKAKQLLDRDGRDHIVFQMQTHSTAAAVRQLGVDEAVGDFIVCFDSDDVMPREYLKVALATFDEETDFVYPRQWWLIPKLSWHEWQPKISEDAIIHQETSIPWRGAIYQYGDATLFMNTDDYKEGCKLGSCMIIASVCRSRCRQEFILELPRLQDWGMHLDLARRGAEGKGFFCAPFIRNRPGSITNATGSLTFKWAQDRVANVYGLMGSKKILVLPLNSSGRLEAGLAGPRIRGCRLASCVYGSEVGDLETIRNRWQEFDVFYFVCAPTPSIVGWIQFLAGKNKKVFFDICVAYWSRDYEFRGFKPEDFSRCLTQIGPHVHFICASSALAENLWAELRLFCTNVVSDSGISLACVKKSYRSSGVLSWCGDFGNIVSLLNYAEELTRITEEYGVTIKLITQKRISLRIPFKWEWEQWSIGTEHQSIVNSDIYLLPQLNVSSYACKGEGKAILAALLGMPIVWVGIEGWEETLVDLLKSEEGRKRVGQDNLRYALNHHITPLVAKTFTEIVECSFKEDCDETS